jgi:hypothetical protein
VVREERKRQSQLGGIRSVTLGRRRVYAEGPDFIVPVQLNLVAHGGELTVSARCVVAGRKDQENPGLLQEPSELICLTVGSGRGEIRGDTARLKQAHDATRLRVWLR